MVSKEERLCEKFAKWLHSNGGINVMQERRGNADFFALGVRGGRGNEDIFQGRHCSRRVSGSIDLQLGCMPTRAPSSHYTVPSSAAGELCCIPFLSWDYNTWDAC